MRKLCLVLALLCNELLMAKENNETLSIDLGGTRVKAAVFPNELTWESLKEIKTYSFSSREWLSEKLPGLLSNAPCNPIATLVGKNCKKISISISGPVIQGQEFIDTYNRGVPFDLKKACEEVIHKNVEISNDAINWAQGYQNYKKLKEEPIHYPSLVVIIGTGLGVVILENETTFHKVETSFIDCPFRKLKEASKDQQIEVNYDRWKARYALGKSYFDWLFNSQGFEDDQMNPYLEKYNNRFNAFVEDLIQWVAGSLDIKVKSLVIGGGYSRFINIPKNAAYKIDLQSPQVFEAEGISPDLIQLLGYSRQEAEKLQVFFYPNLEEVLSCYKIYHAQHANY